MRPKTSRRLRISVVFVVATLVALIAGSAVALATPDPPPGSGYPGEVCETGLLGGLMTAGTAGSDDATVNVGGQLVNVHISWDAHLVFSISITGGKMTYLMIKGGNDPAGGDWRAVYTFNPPVDYKGGLHCGQQNSNDDWQGLSHLNICLVVEDQPEYGSLKVTKSILGDNPGTLGFTNFTITVNGPNSYVWTGPFDINGEVTLTSLEPGPYTIGETPPGYPFTVSGEGGVTVSAGSQTGVTITNTGSTTTTLPDPGSLKITKTIDGDNPAGLDYEDFYVTITGPDSYYWYGHFDTNGEIVRTGLDPGTYTIDEDDPGYPFTVSGEGGVSVSSNQETGVTIINTGRTTTTVVEPGSLRITKTIDGDNPAGLDYEDFYVTITGPDSYYWYGHFDTNGEIVRTGLEPGSYTVDEDDPGYPFSVSGEGGVTVNSEEETGVTIINTGSTTTLLGSLKITKTIDGDNPDSLDYEDFEIAVTGPNSYQWSGSFDVNGEIHLTSLEPGPYTINEQDPGYPFSVSGEGGVTVVAGQETGVTIINTGSTSTTEEVVTSTTGQRLATTTTGGTETTSTDEKSTTTVMGYSNTTVFGWVAQPDDIQTGLGGTAGGGNWALIVLVLASTLLGSVVVASVIGVRAGVL